MAYGRSSRVVEFTGEGHRKVWAKLRLQRWREQYNHSWLLERHGFRSPAQVRADYLEATPMAA
ncbi:hypothetical protein [Halorhodospira halophila]|uniref:hypothetical protein n=1 Tax=Halorhodospira halophila TaxID=1053 RepID=UPI00119824C3|nr:hypothetical protein [Halorhodospira halophila]